MNKNPLKFWNENSERISRGEFTASTSSVPEKYWEDRESGYNDGFDWAVGKVNDRFANWFIVGIFLGMVAGFFAQSGFWTFLSIIGLIFLIDRVNKIEIKK
jgi:hypothetical protein